MSLDRLTEANHNRRMANQHRALTRMERLEREAEQYIGELQGEAGFRYYVNLRDSKGRLTGKIKESKSFFELVDYLVRNRYI